MFPLKSFQQILGQPTCPDNKQATTAPSWQSHVAAVCVLVHQRHCTQAQQSAHFSVAVCRPQRSSRGSRSPTLHVICPQAQALHSTQVPTAPTFRYQVAALHTDAAASSPGGTLSRQQVATILLSTQGHPHLRSPPSSVTCCSEGIWKMKASSGACMQNKQGAGSAEPQGACKLLAARLAEAQFCSCCRWRREVPEMSAWAESAAPHQLQPADSLCGSACDSGQQRCLCSCPQPRDFAGCCINWAAIES